MAASLDDLVPEFKPGAERLLQLCLSRGVEMRPNETLRTPLDQAKIWRQSRSTEEIHAKVASLRAAGAPFLAQWIVDVGPQHGDPVTKAPPGLSWHQWGEALDCFWVVDGKAEWSTTRKVGGVNGYRVYAQAAKELGLEPGGLWRTLKDWPHVQSRHASSPASVFTLPEIDQVMRDRFGR